MTKKCNRLRGERPKAFWGALVGGAMNLIGSAISSKSQARAIRRQIEAQKEAARTQLELANNSNLASTLNSYAAATRSYNNEDDYNLKYRLGGNKRLGSNRIYITDGGNATKIGNDTYLLRGGSHEQTNETGQTGIGINVGGNEIEAEGGEVAQKKNGALRIFSAQPILGGISPAQAVMRGASKDKVFNAQQRFKRRNHLSDGGDRAKWGIGWIDSLFGNDTPKKKTVHFYKSQATGKVFKTRQEAISENNKYKTNLGYRRSINREREVEAAIRKQGNERIPYIKEKEIKLTNAGKLTGIRLSTNQLDSIAKYASKVGLPIKTALGLVGQESAFGNYFGYANNAKDLNTYNTQPKEIRDKYGMPTYKIVNYENLIPERTPTNVDDFAINKRYGKRSVTNFGMPTIINGDELDKLKVQHEAYPALQRKRSKFWRDINTPTLQLAFEHYKTSPQTYNAGNSNQQNLVNSKANDVWGSPEIQKWYRTSPYVKHRLGGRCKLRNGGLTSKDRGSSKHPYPSVSSKDFAGGGRSYPIPTKADAVDALRLAGLHGRSDVRSKVFSKYPSLRKKSSLGSYTPPVKGMRTKFAIGGKKDEGYDMTGELSPVITTAKYRTPSFTTVDTAARAIPNFGTIKAPAYIPPSTVPYIGQNTNRSRTIFTGGDYLGLGIDALSALGTGFITNNAYKNLDFNYNLPNFVEESPVALNTTYHNEAQKSNVERNRLNSRNSILRNTMSGSTAVGRMQGVDTNALYQLNQLADTKENKETELMNQNLLNEQQVRARNAAARNQYYNTVATIKNAALEAKNNASLARSQAFNTSLSGLSQAWNNFYTSGRTAYEDDQARRAMIASSKDATPTKLIEMGYDLSPQIIAALYNTSTNQSTKDFYLSMLDEKQRRKYGIS